MTVVPFSHDLIATPIMAPICTKRGRARTAQTRSVRYGRTTLDAWI
jgi:hypothetical protein